MQQVLDSCILCESSKIHALCSKNHYAECSDCGLVFDSPRPQWEDVLAFYSKQDQYDAWLTELEEREKLWARRLKRVLRHRKSGKLLDVGAGIGQFLSLAGRYFEVTGTEVSPVAVGIAKERYDVSLHLGQLEACALSETFDVITLFHVFEHVPFPGKTLAYLQSLLAPGGMLFIAVPNDVESILTRRNRWMRQLGFRQYQELGELGLPPLRLDGSEIHLSHFRASTLHRALERQGLEVVENSLDPYFAVSGLRKLRRYRRYFTHQLVQLATRHNFYETIFIVARKPTAS